MAMSSSGLLIVYLEGNPRCNGRTDFSANVSNAGNKLAIGSL